VSFIPFLQQTISPYIQSNIVKAEKYQKLNPQGVEAPALPLGK